MSASDLSAILPDVSRETLDRIDAFVALLIKWNSKINLIGRATLDQIWERHIRDSIQIWNLRPEGVKIWADLGAGGGLPGLIVAILQKQADADSRVHLVESDLRKATFLREAARLLELPVIVHNQRIEKLEPLRADVVSARALAPLSDLCSFAALHLAANGTAIFPKGESWESEVDAARGKWHFDLTSVASITASRSSVLLLKDIVHA